MSYTAIYQEMRKKYEALVPTLLTEFPNEDFNKPDGDNWARFTLLMGNEICLSIGSTVKDYRNPGVLIVQLFAPQDMGAVALSEIGDTIADGFRNWCGTTVNCSTSTSKIIGNDGFGWFQINAVVSFHADKQH